ncbi:F-type H+-transporting ATPase subunit b [Loktanella sp. DSM 29012]|uniref:ATP synthase subunit b n=1 Tax=Loktanella gaetbuli TaxID=2881335 RepID=A0ABS8BW83_9RHOB|nr:MULTISPECIES: F0F1 ATP synthase subunit B' [Loktanella]MCB5200006.1 F0F1 ATP synthase subunit B' [Loktanella gaetbuli]SEQ41222.1 F-type H+-transporting ATPase subunit b [Loktanella sp. DSM 29012]
MATETVATEVNAGMPQLNFETFPNQIFWLLVALVVIYLMLSRVALPRISAILAERSGTISNDLAAAEDLKNQAAAAEKSYEKALADARSESNRIADEARAEAQKDLDAALAEADAKISAQTAEAEAAIAEIRANATQNVGEVARDVAQALVSTMGVDVNADAINEAVTARMKG